MKAACAEADSAGQFRPADDIANAALFLASPAARYITGPGFDGGRRDGDVK
jgi:NAD(P)-dependent dehydrogenase (short-subunit alcohol dehydrogenase family)